MAVSLGDISATLQNAVRSIHGLTRQIATTFPSISEFSTAGRGSLGGVTLDASAPVGFIAVQTSSGLVGYVPIYPSS
jgi:hypothetical protein